MPIRPEFRGVVLMIVGTAFLSGNDALSKVLTQDYPIGQVVCLRQVASLMFILPFALATSGIRSLAIVDRAGQAWRAMAFVLAAGLMVASLANLPLPIVSAIAFSSPIWVAALAGRALAETVTLRRWLAIAVGFLGVLVIVRPGGAAFEWALLLPVATALTIAARDMLTRHISRTETSISVLFWSAVATVLMSAVWAAFDWRPVTSTGVLLFLLNGALNAIAHFAIIAAFRHGDASALSPLRYLSLAWSIVLAWLIWRYQPELPVVAGMVLIVAGAVWGVERTAATARASPRA